MTRARDAGYGLIRTDIMERKDAVMPDEVPPLALQKHIDYIVNYGKKTDDMDYLMSEHLRLSGIYWCLTGIFELVSSRSKG